ncbi:MAG: hypothetical protein QOJ46_555 [bacterium]
MGVCIHRSRGAPAGRAARAAFAVVASLGALALAPAGRAARAAFAVVATLAVLALAPASASAAIAGSTTVSMPSAVTVGQTGVIATITLTNENTYPDDAVPNSVCGAGDGFPCAGAGIALLPACGSLSGITDCSPGREDPGVFTASPVATGEAGTECPDVSFAVSAPDPLTGALQLTPPAETPVVLPAAGSRCTIDVTLAVVGMPAEDADPMVDGVQTVQIASATQKSGSFAHESAGTSVTTVVPATPPPPPPPPPPLRATPTIGVAASPGIVIGGQVFANATVGSRVNAVGGATVTFRLFDPDDSTCVGTPAFSATAPVNGLGVATSPPFTPPSPQTGIYRWTASYSGDPNNLPVASACGAPGSTVTVTPLPAQILSAGFRSTPRVGQLSFLTVGAFDPSQRVSGLQVRFGEPRGLAGISACRLRGLAIARSPIRLRLPYIFRGAGRHRVTIIVLSGGCSGRLTRRTMTIDVDVSSGRPARQAFAATGGAAKPGARAAVAGSCANTFLRPTNSAASRLKVATAILCLVNVERARKGLEQLKPSRILAVAAAEHSKDMLKRRFFEHAGPGGPSLQARLERIRYGGTTTGENIANGSNFNAKLVVQAWMNGPPPKANILAPRLRFLGVGIAVGIPVTPGDPGSTYTQEFGSTLK